MEYDLMVLSCMKLEQAVKCAFLWTMKPRTTPLARTHFYPHLIGYQRSEATLAKINARRLNTALRARLRDAGQFLV